MKDLTKGNELKTIIYFSLPILIGNLFQQIYNISDTIIVGNFLGKESLAAVGSSYQINVLIIAVSIGISLGTSILISQYFGAKDMENEVGCYYKGTHWNNANSQYKAKQFYNDEIDNYYNSHRN